MDVKTEPKSDVTGRHNGKPSLDDIGVAVIAEAGEVESFTDEDEKAVRWKIDLHLMPLVRILHCHILYMMLTRRSNR